MNNTFKREQKYLVIKVKDAKHYLDEDQLEQLAGISDTIEVRRKAVGLPGLECVVIESHWPEYEATWKAIEARVTGTQPAPSVPDDVIEQAVNRFLSWKLPKDFRPDGGMVFIPTKDRGYDSPYWPSGTNLFNAEQAREMLRYVLAAAAAPEAKP